MIASQDSKIFDNLCEQLRKDKTFIAIGGLLGSAESEWPEPVELGPYAFSPRDESLCKSIQQDVVAQSKKQTIIYVNYLTGTPDYDAIFLKMRRRYFRFTDQAYMYHPKSTLAPNCALIWIIATQKPSRAVEGKLREYLDSFAARIEARIRECAARALFLLTKPLHRELGIHLDIVVNHARECAQATDCIIWEKEPERTGLKTAATTLGLPMDLPPNVGVGTEAFRSGQIIVIRDLQAYLNADVKSHLRAVHPSIITESGWRRAVYCPIFYRDKRIGVLAQYFDHCLKVEPGEIDVIKAVADLIGIYLGRRQNPYQENIRMQKMREIAPVIHAGLTSKNIIHNMPTYLDGVVGLLAHVKSNDPSLSEDSQKVLDEAIKNIAETQDMARRVLHIANAKNINLEPTTVNYIFRQIERLFQSRCARHDIKLNLGQPVRAEIFVDRILIEQAIYNLMDNAIGFLADSRKSEKRISVGSHVLSPHHIALTILDTGPGIRASDLDEIWEFLISTRGGSGLGLPMTKRIIEDIHGGKIAVRSEHLRFTEMTILLPVYAR